MCKEGLDASKEAHSAILKKMKEKYYSDASYKAMSNVEAKNGLSTIIFRNPKHRKGGTSFFPLLDFSVTSIL